MVPKRGDALPGPIFSQHRRTRGSAAGRRFSIGMRPANTGQMSPNIDLFEPSRSYKACNPIKDVLMGAIGSTPSSGLAGSASLIHVGTQRAPTMRGQRRVPQCSNMRDQRRDASSSTMRDGSAIPERYRDAPRRIAWIQSHCANTRERHRCARGPKARWPGRPRRAQQH